MSGPALLEELSGLGVRLWVEGEKLRYRGSKEVLTPDVLAKLKESKPEIMASLAPPVKDVELPTDVLELAHARFGPSQPLDPADHPLPLVPDRDPLTKHGTDKTGFFKGDWRRAWPRNFKVYGAADVTMKTREEAYGRRVGNYRIRSGVNSLRRGGAGGYRIPAV